MNDKLQESPNLIMPPIRLRIIGWFWIAIGVTAFARDFCGHWFLNLPLGFDLAWFCPIIGWGMIRFGYLRTVAGRGLAWLGAIGGTMAFMLLSFFSVQHLMTESSVNPAPPAKVFLANSVFLAFFVWQLRVLYQPAIKGLAIRGASKHQPKAIFRIDLLSLFFTTFVCVWIMTELVSLRAPIRSGRSISGSRHDGGVFSIYTSDGWKGMFGRREHGRAVYVAKAKSVGSSGSISGDGTVASETKLSVELMDGREIAINSESDDFGIAIHDGERLETSPERVRADLFVAWVESYPEELSVAALLEYVKQHEEE